MFISLFASPPKIILLRYQYFLQYTDYTPCKFYINYFTKGQIRHVFHFFSSALSRFVPC